MDTLFSLKPVLVWAGLLVAGMVTAQPDTLSFLHITDMHTMFNLENYHPGIVHHREKVRNYENANHHLQTFLQTIPEETGSDMVMATGDMIDFFQAETDSGNMVGFQVEQFAGFVENFRIPVYLTLGNHETFSYDWKDEKLIPDQFSAGKSKAAWIRNFDCFRHGTYYSRTFRTGETTYRLIFLDDGFYRFLPEENMVNPYIDKPQLHWLKTELNAHDDDVEIILMHIPFSKASVQAGTSHELFTTLLQHPSVKLILSGHHHRNLIQSFAHDKGRELNQVETDALVETPANWRQIRLTENTILVSEPGNRNSELVIPVKP